MPARRRAPYHHGDLKETLLRSAARIIRKRGVAFVSLREVARDARVSHSAPAHHFGNKAGLLTAFATQGFMALGAMATMEVERSKKEDAPAMLEALGRGYVRFALENPDQFSVMFRSELLDTSDPRFSAAANAAYALLTSIVKQCVREGFLEGSDVDSIAAAAWAIAHGLATLWIGGRLPARSNEEDGNVVAARALKAFVDGTIRSTRALPKRS